jgi:hypothetical protein
MNTLNKEEQKQEQKIKKYGTKEEVYNGLAEKTKGKLKKDDLFECPRTKKIKSKKMSELGKARFIKK